MGDTANAPSKEPKKKARAVYAGIFASWDYIGIILGLYIGIMEKKMETTIIGVALMALFCSRRELGGASFGNNPNDGSWNRHDFGSNKNHVYLRQEPKTKEAGTKAEISNITPCITLCNTVISFQFIFHYPYITRIYTLYQTLFLLG